MKLRESGMPEEELWASFFDPQHILTQLELDSSAEYVVEFGCGYGTFTIPAARLVRGTVFSFDIEEEMVLEVGKKSALAGIANIHCEQRDFAADGTGLADGVADYVMLFNILHCRAPLRLLREAYRVLVPGGKVGVIHWNYDAETPRGPPMNIRPRPEQCREWITSADLYVTVAHVDLPPYHYGIVGTKT